MLCLHTRLGGSVAPMHVIAGHRGQSQEQNAALPVHKNLHIRNDCQDSVVQGKTQKLRTSKYRLLLSQSVECQSRQKVSQKWCEQSD